MRHLNRLITILSTSLALVASDKALACYKEGPTMYDFVIPHVELTGNTPEVFYVRFQGSLEDLNALANGSLAVRASTNKKDPAYFSMRAAQMDGGTPAFVLSFNKRLHAFVAAYNGTSGREVIFYRARGRCGVTFR